MNSSHNLLTKYSTDSYFKEKEKKIESLGKHVMDSVFAGKYVPGSIFAMIVDDGKEYNDIKSNDEVVIDIPKEDNMPSLDDPMDIDNFDDLPDLVPDSPPLEDSNNAESKFPTPLNPEANEKKEIVKKKIFKNYISAIESNELDKNKINLNESKYQFSSFITPHYQYSDKNNDLFIIQTPFINVIKNKINYYRKSNNIYLSHELFDSNIIKLLIEYDSMVHKYIKEKHNYVPCLNQLIYNKAMPNYEEGYKDVNLLNELGSIRAKLQPLHKYYGKIINYNVSIKYPKVEEFDLKQMKPENLFSTLDRILTNNKQMRLLMSPTTWIMNGQYGSYLNIFMIEVKYKNAKIQSVLDKKEVNMRKEIINISI
jgi:hypothetical protein